MKTSKLLVLGALWLTTTGAMATIVDGVRQKPVPQTQGFVASADTTENYYLYNVDAKAFFTEGNAWGTQVSVGDKGLKVAFTYAADGVYLLNDFSVSKGDWKLTFFDSETAMFVDRGSQANYGWAVDESGATFRLHAAAYNDAYNPTLNSDTYPDMFVGLDVTENATNTACSPFLTADEGHLITWTFVTPDNYAAYETAVNVYLKAEELRAKIAEAKEKGVNTTAAETAYLNESLTVEELQAAIDALQQAINQAAEQNASVSNPQDLSSLIVNRDFAGDDLTTGWSGEPWGAYGGKENVEQYNKTYDSYQKITGLPNGVYAVGANAFYRAGNAQPAYDNYKANNEASRYAKLYAVTGTDTMTVAIVSPFTAGVTESVGVGTESTATDSETGDVFYIPNNMVAAETWMHELGFYKNQVLVGIDDNTLTIGAYKKSTISGDWSIFDDFSLTYYGNSTEAFQYWVSQAKESATKYTGDELITTSVLAAYNNAVNNASGSTKEQAIAAIKAIEEAEAALLVNMGLWQQWKAKVEEATEFLTQDAYVGLTSDALDELDQYVNLDAEEVEENKALTNEELQAEIEKIDAWMAKIKDDAAKALKPGDDVTYLLNNPNFDTNDWTGWTKTNASGGNVQVTYQCAEFWDNASFDLYQEIKNAPVGVYAISVQGFYRYLRDNNAWSAWTGQTSQYVKESPCYVYLNDIQTPFMNIFGEEITDNSIFGEHTNYNTFEKDGVSYYAPNDMATAADCFGSPSQVNDGQNMFTQSAFGLIANAGDVLRIGVTGKSNQGNDSWVIFDTFKLTFMGNDFATIKSVLEPEVAKAQAMTSQWMGKSVYAALTQAIAAANAAITANDGNAAFTALRNLVAAESSVSASVALFDELDAALTELGTTINDAVNDDATGEASEFIDDTREDMDSHAIEDEEVPALLAKIKELKTKLMKPAPGNDLVASDWSTLIVNANYNNNATDGWTTAATTGYNNTDGNNCVEIFDQTFDYYQDIYGLDAGTYEVKVQGFYRYNEGAHGPAVDYANINDDSKSLAFLYADGGNGCGSKALKRLCSEYYYETATGLSEVAENAGMFVPNTQAAAGKALVADGMYSNSLIVKVNADGKLRIGVKKDAKPGLDWVVFAQWQLYNYGASSTKVADGDAMGQGIENLLDSPVARVEFYTIDGRRATATQKGLLVQKTTLQNGMVVVRKIQE